MAAYSLADTNLFAYCRNNPVTSADDDGELPHVVIGAAVGAVAGFVGQIVSDAITSILSGSLRVSNWQTYTGAVVGGAVGGAILAGTGSVGLANAATGAVTTGLGLSLEKLTISGYDKSWTEIGINTAADGAISWGLEKLHGIKSVTAGRNNWNAVYRAGLTKMRRGIASRMSSRVVLKGVGSSAVGGLALDGYYGVKQYSYDKVKNYVRYYYSYYYSYYFKK